MWLLILGGGSRNVASTCFVPLCSRLTGPATMHSPSWGKQNKTKHSLLIQVRDLATRIKGLCLILDTSEADPGIGLWIMSFIWEDVFTCGGKRAEQIGHVTGMPSSPRRCPGPFSSCFDLFLCCSVTACRGWCCELFLRAAWLSPTKLCQRFRST